jgi:hypothetical protein
MPDMVGLDLELIEKRVLDSRLILVEYRPALV